MKATTKKILIFAHTAELTGATRSLLDLMNALRNENNIQLLIFVRTDGALVQKLQELEISYKIIHFPFNVAFGVTNPQKLPLKKKLNRCARKVKQYYSVYKAINDEVKQFNPHVIYTNTSVVYWGMLISFFSFKKHIWHIREMKEQFNMQHDFGIGFFKILLKRSCIICNSKAVANNYDIQGSRNSQIIYNGLYTIPEATELYNKRTKKNSSTINFGIIAGIEETKGQLTVLEALGVWRKQQTLNFKLYLIGHIDDEKDKRYLNYVKEYIAGNHLEENVIFTGFVEDVNNYYQLLDILICPSLHEAFGRVIIEAIARGIFVIARRTGGIPEIIEHKNHGLLYNNNKELIDNINWYLSNTATAEQVKYKAFEKIKNSFSKEQYVLKMKHILLN